MRKRIRCLWHKEETPSLVQRKDGWYCYGACNKLYSNEVVKERTGLDYEYEEVEVEKEDLKETFSYIDLLPTKTIRGIPLPCDESGYYIIWPEKSYYKYRRFTPGKGPKYIGPKGCGAPPLFWSRRDLKNSLQTLCITEGEINALSTSLAYPEWDVCSPGSATMFNSANLAKYLHVFKEYNKIVVVLDKDPAGTKALIESRAFFLYKIPFTSFIQLEKDCNEVLCEKGQKGLREELSRANHQ